MYNLDDELMPASCTLSLFLPLRPICWHREFYNNPFSCSFLIPVLLLVKVFYVLNKIKMSIHVNMHEVLLPVLGNAGYRIELEWQLWLIFTSWLVSFKDLFIISDCLLVLFSIHVTNALKIIGVHKKSLYMYMYL